MSRQAQSAIYRNAALLLLTFVLVAPGVPLGARNDLCGATIVADLKLDHDLTCAGDGLIVGADGIRLDLGEHTITGAGGAVGIVVSGRTNVQIAGGIITNFEAGIGVTNSTGIAIEGSQLVGNNEGIDLQSGSRASLIKGNEFRDNRARGIMLRGEVIDNVIKENSFTGNRVGILLFAPVGTTVKENVMILNGLAGIRVNVFATGNLIKENTVVSNPAGIEFLVTPTGGSGIGNEVLENALLANACGLKGPTAGNSVAENVFAGNVADICH